MPLRAPGTGVATEPITRPSRNARDDVERHRHVLGPDRLGRVVADPVLAAHEQHPDLGRELRRGDGVVAAAAAELERALARLPGTHERAVPARSATWARRAGRRAGATRAPGPAVRRSRARPSRARRGRGRASRRPGGGRRTRPWSMPAITFPTFGSLWMRPTVAVRPSVSRASRSTSRTSSAAPASASRRRRMGVLPACPAIPVKTASPRLCAAIAVTMPTARSSSWSTGPCSMCTSR